MCRLSQTIRRNAEIYWCCHFYPSLAMWPRCNGYDFSPDQWKSTIPTGGQLFRKSAQSVLMAGWPRFVAIEKEVVDPDAFAVQVPKNTGKTKSGRRSEANADRKVAIRQEVECLLAARCGNGPPSRALPQQTQILLGVNQQVWSDYRPTSLGRNAPRSVHVGFGVHSE